MPDLYTRITEAPPNILEGLIIALETRAADPQQRAMLNTYLNDAALPPNPRVLEIGCGTGVVTRVLAAWLGVSEAIGVDPFPVFVAKARELAKGMTTFRFRKRMVARCRDDSAFAKLSVHPSTTLALARNLAKERTEKQTKEV